MSHSPTVCPSPEQTKLQIQQGTAEWHFQCPLLALVFPETRSEKLSLGTLSGLCPESASLDTYFVAFLTLGMGQGWVSARNLIRPPGHPLSTCCILGGCDCDRVCLNIMQRKTAWKKIWSPKIKHEVILILLCHLLFKRFISDFYLTNICIVL